MALLDRNTLASALNRADIGDNTLYPDTYLDGVIADVQATIASYLGYDPVLQVVTGEEGPVELDGTGYYRSLYRLQLGVAPLIPGAATIIFSALSLTYTRSTQVTVPVNLAYATVQHPASHVFIAPGALSALSGVSFDLGGPFGYLQADGYTADYVAGYATGINDPIPGGGGSYNARTMPGNITQAAVLLCRERLAMDDAANTRTTLPSAGLVTSERTEDQARTYASPTVATGVLGYGTALSQAATAKLRLLRRSVIA